VNDRGSIFGRGSGFLCSPSRPDRLWGPPVSYQWGTGGCFLGVKREADHSPPSSAEVKNLWSYTSTPSHDFMAWYFVKHRPTLPLHDPQSVIHLAFSSKVFPCLRTDSRRRLLRSIFLVIVSFLAFLYQCLDGHFTQLITCAYSHCHVCYF
jgi:hypothetical protein